MRMCIIWFWSLMLEQWVILFNFSKKKHFEPITHYDLVFISSDFLSHFYSYCSIPFYFSLCLEFRLQNRLSHQYHQNFLARVFNNRCLNYCRSFLISQIFLFSLYFSRLLVYPFSKCFNLLLKTHGKCSYQQSPRLSNLTSSNLPMICLFSPFIRKLWIDNIIYLLNLSNFNQSVSSYNLFSGWLWRFKNKNQWVLDPELISLVLNLLVSTIKVLEKQHSKKFHT